MKLEAHFLNKWKINELVRQLMNKYVNKGTIEWTCTQKQEWLMNAWRAQINV
jgi:hypothetical protein